MKFEDVNIDYLVSHTRMHSIDILDRNGIIGQSENGYSRMISKIIEPISNKESDYTILGTRDMVLYEAIRKFHKENLFTTYKDFYKKTWLHFDVNIRSNNNT